MVNVGSTWRSSDYKSFVVEAVKKLDGDTWVHYAKADKFGCAGDEKYSCLEDAFKVRFHPEVSQCRWSQLDGHWIANPWKQVRFLSPIPDNLTKLRVTEESC